MNAIQPLPISGQGAADVLMGEAKRRKLATGREKCVCGSGRIAFECCFENGHWMRRPADLGLRALPKGEALARCYLAALQSCGGGLSAEHLISESVMRLLAGDGEFSIGGAPWLGPGEFKTVGFSSLTSKCLCRTHNSALSPLDAAALELFTVLRSAFENDDAAVTALISGHDIERWLLKTLKAMAVSRNLGRGDEQLDGEFSPGIDVASLLSDWSAWPKGAGLYCVMAPGDLTQNHNRFQLAPITQEDGQLSGLWASILGISFMLLLEPLDLTRSRQMPHAVFRPGGILVDHPKVQSRILLSWSDGQPHGEIMSLTFKSKLTDQQAGADADQ